MFQYSLTERTVPVPVSVPGKNGSGGSGSGFGSQLGKRFRRFRFPVPVRFLGLCAFFGSLVKEVSNGHVRDFFGTSSRFLLACF